MPKQVFARVLANSPGTLRSSRVLRGTMAASLLALAGGCAQITSVQPGTPMDVVVSKYGKPAVICAQPDGSKRAVWTAEPAGESAWATKILADRTVTGFEQVLNKSHLALVQPGVWTTDQVRCEFGPPAMVESFGGQRGHGPSWGYHFMEAGGFYGLMWIDFELDLRTVRKVSTEIDPDRDPSMMGGRR